MAAHLLLKMKAGDMAQVLQELLQQLQRLDSNDVMDLWASKEKLYLHYTPASLAKKGEILKDAKCPCFECFHKDA